MGKKTEQDMQLPLSAELPSAPREGRHGRVLLAFVLGICTLHHYNNNKTPHEPSTAVGTLTWSKCGRNSKSQFCGNISVPKDYFDESAGIASIALARYAATKLPSKGTVLLNPGGPGGSGVALVESSGDRLATIIGHDWDIVGFDPRGIGKTVPKVQCFTNPIQFRLFTSNTILEQGYTIPSVTNFSAAAAREALIPQYKEHLTLKKSQAEVCAKRMGDELRYMGTATVVRDMDFMSKVFDGPNSKINYWGGSYGSILGAYLVNMLPHRIGYALIDGIADPVAWSNLPPHKWPQIWVASSEKTYEVFLTDCSNAGPLLCPLTKYTGEPIAKIEHRIEEFLDKIAIDPLVVPFGVRPGYLTSGAIRNLILITLQRPRIWPQAAVWLAEAMLGDGTNLFNMLVPDPAASLSGAQDLARLAVTCMDSPSVGYPTAEELADEGINALKYGSKHFGISTTIGEPDGGCEFWKVKGPERFTGPWNATLERPMLIVSNTADPITPIQSGLKVNLLMPNSSILIIQDGPGHCSLAMPSLCTGRLTRGYFAGTLPVNGTVCGIDAPTFPSPSNETVKMLSAEDQELFDAMEKLGTYMDDVHYGFKLL